MAKDEDIKTRILVQVSQMGSFDSTNAQEVACVERLISDGLVVGHVVREVNGDCRSKIERLTGHGQSVLDSYKKPKAHSMDAGDVARMSLNTMIENDRVFDNTLLTLSSAGMAVLFGVLPLFEKCISKLTNWTFFCYCTAILCWGLSAIVLLISHKTSSAAFSRVASRESDKATKVTRITAILNWVSFGLFVFASIAFTVFICFVSYKVMKVGG